MGIRKRTRRLFIPVFVLGLSLGGCVTNNFPGSHTAKADKFRQALNAGDTKSAQDYLLSKKESEDNMLYMMELGRIHNLQNQHPQSLDALGIVVEKFEQNDSKALISAGSAADHAQAALVNDTMIEYKGYGFERIFTHVHQVFNYLGEGKHDDALVEVRKIALEEKELTEAHEKEIAKTAEKAKEKNININMLDEKFSGIDLIAGKTKSSFSNAYAHYLSGVLMEATGKASDKEFALTSYKLAFEIHPGSTMIQKDIERLSGKDIRQSSEVDSEKGTLVVLYEDDFVAKRTGITIPIPTASGSAVAVSFPMYTKESVPPVQNLQVSGNGVSVTTGELTNTSALAAKSLKEEIPAMVLRAVIRVAAKYAIQDQAGKQWGDAGKLVAGLYNVASEQADLRNWLTLPNSCQVARVPVVGGKQTLALQSGGINTSVDVDIQPGKTTLVRAVNVGQRLLVNTYQL